MKTIILLLEQDLEFYFDKTNEDEIVKIVFTSIATILLIFIALEIILLIGMIIRRLFNITEGAHHLVWTMLLGVVGVLGTMIVVKIFLLVYPLAEFLLTYP